MSSDDSRLARKGAQLEGVAIAFLILSWAFIALRIWTRTRVRPNFSWDDSTMILAAIIFSVYCSCILYIEGHGGGTHVTNLQQLNHLTKWVIISEATYILTVLAVKMSLAIFFMRIVVKTCHTTLINVTMAIVSISSVATFFYCIFRCGSNINNYVLNQLKDKCMDRTTDRVFAYQHAAIGLLTDCVFVVLPVLLLWKVNMERRSKILAGVILSVATLGCICSAVRFRYVDGLTEVHDFFWAATNVSIWSTIEPGAAIMAGCAATLRPLLALALEKVQSIRSHSAQFSDPNNSYSSNKKSNTRSYVHHAGRPSRLDKVDERDMEANHAGIVEMQSKLSKKNESSDCILPYQSEPSIESAS